MPGGRYLSHEYGTTFPHYLPYYICVAHSTRVTRCEDAEQDDSCRVARMVSRERASVVVQQ